MSGICCTGQACPGNTIPTVCSFDCARAFTTFLADCHDVLAPIIGPDDLRKYVEFGNLCTNLDVRSLVSAIHGSHCWYCGDGSVDDDEECNAGDVTDECASSPCQNGGVCFDGHGGYTCQCVEGFDGSDCEQTVPAIYLCHADYGETDCDGHATCTHTGPGTHDCVCLFGYSGDGHSCAQQGMTRCLADCTLEVHVLAPMQQAAVIKNLTVWSMGCGHGSMKLDDDDGQRLLDPLRPGIWSWACGGAGYGGARSEDYVQECFDQVHAPPPWLRGWFMRFYWADLEPEDGVYDWSLFDKNLSSAAASGLQVQPVVYLFQGGHALPRWMSNISRAVKFHRGGKAGPLEDAPNFLDPAFQSKWQRMTQALAEHLGALPPKLKESIWAVQAVAGITGDNRPYNGVVADPSNAITAPAWINYSRFVAEMYVDAFLPSGIPVIANLHDGFSKQQDQGWFLRMAFEKGMRGAAVKEGIVSHWYQCNAERMLFELESPLLLQPQPDGSYARSRGELAVEPDPGPEHDGKPAYGNWAEAPAWSLQALAEWGLTFGLDVWNLYSGFLGNATFAPTMEFFNRHAGHKNASEAPAAFISFRDSLDTADVSRWPVEQYGPVNSSDNPTMFANSTRMEKIASEHAARGARIGSAGAASAKVSVHQKKAAELIDVCWECYQGNYGRYIEQLSPIGTSVGWWQVGPRDEPYGRFARGLEHSSGRTTIRLRMDPRFGEPGKSRATVRVAYLDHGAGRWTLGCDGAVAATVRKTGGDGWRLAEANVTLCRELVLASLDGEDDVFSLLEVLLQ